MSLDSIANFIDSGTRSAIFTIAANNFGKF